MIGNFKRKKLLWLLVILVISSNTALAESVKKTSEVTAKVNAGYDDTGFEENISTAIPGKGVFFVKGASDINFPQIKLGDEDYAIFNNAKVDALGVEVVDLRGTGGGWTLRLKLGPIKLKDENSELENFTLTIPTKEVTSKMSSADKLPKGHKLEFEGSGEKTIFSAGENKGMGKYTNVFVRKKDSEKKGISLKVPITAKSGSYLGELDWILIDGPT